MSTTRVCKKKRFIIALETLYFSMPISIMYSRVRKRRIMEEKSREKSKLRENGSNVHTEMTWQAVWKVIQLRHDHDVRARAREREREREREAGYCSSQTKARKSKARRPSQSATKASHYKPHHIGDQAAENPTKLEGFSKEESSQRAPPFLRGASARETQAMPRTLLADTALLSSQSPHRQPT